MIDKEIRIINKLGLHARAAAKFVHTANHFKARITIRKDARTIDGKSILGILMLAAGQGTALTLHVEGPDEREALQALVGLVENLFGEGQ